MLANLLARQYGVVEEILLDVPDCEIHTDTFLLNPAGTDLQKALLNLIEVVGGTEITGRSISDADIATVELLVGMCEPSPTAEFSASVAGNGCNFACTTTHVAPATEG